MSSFCSLLFIALMFIPSLARAYILQDTVRVADLEVVVGQENEAMLAAPSELIRMNDDRFALYDPQLSSIMVFNMAGDLQYSFGRSGEGPGEWSGSGAKEISFVNDTFLLNNDGNYSIDSYTAVGELIATVLYPEELNLNPKCFPDPDHMLTGTYGKDGVLVKKLQIRNDFESSLAFGDPAMPYSGYSKFGELEERRKEFARGNIPAKDLNRVLISCTKGKTGIFKNTIGELVIFDQSGNPLQAVTLPQEIFEPLKQKVFSINDDGNPYTLFPLNYAIAIDMNEDRVAVLTGTLGPEHEEIKQHILIYDLSGTLIQHSVIANMDNQFFAGDLLIYGDRVLMTDLLNAQILSLPLN